MSRYYTTVQGDEWDMIALKVYGDESYLNALLKANQKYNNIVVFSSGVKLLLPEIEVKSTTILPPWKR